jgi:mono/diheme cytochrome c family protein
MKRWKWLAGIAAVIVAIPVVAIAYIYVASERLLERNYPLPPSSVRASQDAAAIARGDRLAHAFGCTDCHRPNLEGAFIPDFGVWSLNLTQLATTFSDQDFDRAIRHGLRPDGTSVAEFMPSDAFQYMGDADLGDILAFIRAHPPHGVVHAVPSHGIVLRFALLIGRAKTGQMWFPLQKPALDPGPKYDRGRHLAMTACGECHTTELHGAIPPQSGQPPNLSIVAAYDRAAFLKFMHTGKAAGNRELPMMSAVARVRISHLGDADLNALYDYLVARGRKLTGSGG